VVRDLWDLRTRGGGALAVGEETQQETQQDEGLAMFSSQPTADEKSKDSTPKKQQTRAQSWNPEENPDWPMPSMIDTLALCYLGCLLLRIPTAIGELCLWANAGRIPYKRSVSRMYSGKDCRVLMTLSITICPKRCKIDCLPLIQERSSCPFARPSRASTCTMQC
jgi:hypothetical protein